MSPEPSVVQPSEVQPSGTTSDADASAALVSALDAIVYDPEKGKKIEGRNLPWDALVAETEEHGQANAARVGRALKSIRGEVWEVAQENGLTLDFVAARWEEYEHDLAAEITRRVRWLKREKPDLTWGAEGVARWWSRVPVGGEDARMARMEALVAEGVRRAEERRR